MRQEIGWFDVRNAGELSNRLIEDLGKNIESNMNYLELFPFLIFIDKIKDGIKYENLIK